MLIGDLDLERALRDPAYRRKVTAFLTGGPGKAGDQSEGERRGERQDAETPVKPAQARGLEQDSERD